MTGAGGSTRRRVLHVVEGGGSFTDELSATLSSAGVEQTIVADVYLGLARMVRLPRVRYDAAVVNLDGLEGDEIDFISHVQRQQAQIPIFVYGRPDSTGRAAEAERRGARFVREVSAIQSALALDVDRPTASEPPADPVESVEATPSSDEDRTPADGSAMPESVHPDVREPSRPSGEPEEPNAGDADARVPTPWAPSPHRPIRQGPAGRNETDSRSPGEPDGRPVLTDEELSALLGPDRAGTRDTTGEGQRESERAS